MSYHSFFATAARATADLVASELRELGARDIEERPGGVAFCGELEVAYRACLWSRVASRVLLRLGSFVAADAEALYQGARAIAWHEHLGPDDTFAVDVAGTGMHAGYAALKVKDAIADVLRQRYGRRPSVEVERPSVRVNLHLGAEQVSISIDLCGTSLHQRGYREVGAPAPLKETLAAAMLLRSRWPAAAREGAAFFDPMCGSGTLPIEAALLAADIAPGTLRGYWGFVGWRGHDAQLWSRLLDEAAARRQEGLRRLPVIGGSDIDSRAVGAALINAERAGLAGRVQIANQRLQDVLPPARYGLVLTNPPYGERLGDARHLVALYQELGQKLKEHFGGWTAHVLTANEELAGAIGLRHSRVNSLWNGGLACRLLHYKLTAPKVPKTSAAPSPDLANRLRKNAKRLVGWAKAEGVSCYRVYDADLPEFAAAIDIYESFAQVAEYAPPKSVDAGRARRRLRQIVATLPSALGIAPEHVFLKVRERQRGLAQYEKLAEGGAFHRVHEGGHVFLVNFTDFLDTGLFLDHRLTRRYIGEHARGRRFLNLFAYTGSATVYAAKGGAASTTSVDLSQTYLHWARQNLSNNDISVAGARHRLVQDDCIRWLAEERGEYDLIFMDPPTFSNSKRMEGVLDIQRDHVQLIRDAARLLAADGMLLFSTNFRRFRLDMAGLSGLSLENISTHTLPKDFANNPRIHQCWRITK